MKTVKELWIDIFDTSLEKFEYEDVSIRNMAMILHTFQLEFKKISKYISELQQKNELQTREIIKLNQNCTCKNNDRSPLKTLIVNRNDASPPIRRSETCNMSYEIEGEDDIFNHQISEIDHNTSKENDSSLFIDNSLKDYDSTTSPTLNKSKRKSRVKNQTINSSVIHGTPTLTVHKVKKLKQSKISLCYDKTGITLLQKNESTAKNETLVDNDETIYLSAHNSDKHDNLDVEVILDQLSDDPSNKSKKIKLNNSFDCLPMLEKKSDFEFQRDIVRKKSEREKLKGWDCPDCEKYYANMDLSEGEMKKRMDKCSKHRNNFNPNILTPKGFWDVDFSPTQDSFAFNF